MRPRSGGFLWLPVAHRFDTFLSGSRHGSRLDGIRMTLKPLALMLALVLGLVALLFSNLSRIRREPSERPDDA